MTFFHHIAEIPPEAGIALLLFGVGALIVGLKTRPKTTVALLVLGLCFWAYSENSEMLHQKFMDLSQVNKQ